MSRSATALALLAAAALGGCASSASQQAGDAAATPLHDVNVVRAEIPPVLQAAARAPYAPPADASCAGLATAVQALDAALGADLDTPATAANPSLLERGAGEALRSAAEGVIPFRGWVRKLSGAERYERRVEAAITAGGVRRAYLKGLGQAAGCAAPAAPKAASAP
ncbi:MAG TPA: hypothetical protein VFQ16_09480 [Burkholderiaceae bacterium]|nr:hypothetical protein [Burkholderiaceae bacterium]